MCVCYLLPLGPSVSPGKMRTPPVLVWWCQWSGPAMLALCVFGLQWEVHSLDPHTQTHTNTRTNAQTRFISLLSVKPLLSSDALNTGIDEPKVSV